MVRAECLTSGSSMLILTDFPRLIFRRAAVFYVYGHPYVDDRRKAETRRIREIFMPELVLRLHQELMVSRHLFAGYVVLFLVFLSVPDP